MTTQNITQNDGSQVSFLFVAILQEKIEITTITSDYRIQYTGKKRGVVLA